MSNKISRMSNYSKSEFSMPSHPLNTFKKQKHCQNKPKFNSIYSKNNSPKTKDVGYVINLNEYKSIRTDWIEFFVKRSNLNYEI